MNLAAPVSASPLPTPMPIGMDYTPHGDSIAKARGGDALGGTAGALHVETLPNGVRMVIAERPGAKSVKVQFGIGAGSLQDPEGKLGMAHLLEHLAFEGSPTRSAPVQEKLRISMGNNWNAYTDRNSIVYYGIVPNKDAAKAANLLGDMFRNPAVTGPRVAQEKAAVENEMIYGDGSIAGDLWHVNQRLVYGDDPRTNNVIGTRKTVDKITTKDMRAFHDAYFTGRNTVALVEGDPKSLPLDQVRKALSALPAGARVAHDDELVDPLPGKAIQVVKDPAHGAIDLTLTIPLTDAQMDGIDPMRKKLIATSLDQQLNNTLRRYHHLTYGGSASFGGEDAGTGAQLVLNASVEPSEIRQAAKDFVSIIRDARDGFGKLALQRDKQQLASRLRMKEPDMTIGELGDVAEVAFQTALTDKGIDGSMPSPPDSAKRQQKDIDADIRKLNAITGEQFAKTAAPLLSLDNVKVLAYGDVDTTELRAGLKEGGLDLAGVKMNPVDLSMYRDMGLGLPKQD